MGARKAGIELGRKCKHCDTDEWRENSRGTAFCLHCDRTRAAERMSTLREDVCMSLWLHAQQRSRSNMVPFSITPDDIRAVWPIDERCPVFGQLLIRGTGFMSDNSPTLDRMNSEWGYTPDNIAVISMKANRAKGGLTAVELERIVNWMKSNGLA